MSEIINESAVIPFAMIPRCVILDKTISPTLLRVYCYLISRCCGHKSTWVSQDIMAIDLGMDRRTIRANLIALQERKLIAIEKDESRNSNIYRIFKVEDVYGQDVASKEWPKRSTYGKIVSRNKKPVEHGDTPPVEHGDTPPVEHGDTPPVEHGDTPEVEEPQGEEIKDKNQGEELVPHATASSKLPCAAASGGKLPTVYKPSIISKKAEQKLKLGREWLEANLRRSPTSEIDRAWTIDASVKALEKEMKWIRKNSKGREAFTWEELETVLAFIDKHDFLRMNIRSPFKLCNKWKKGRVMQCVLDDFEASKENRFLRMAKNAAEELMEYREEDWTMEGILRRARNGY